MTWPTVALGDVSEVIMGQAPPGESYNDLGQGLPLIAGAGDFKNGIPQAKKYTSSASKIAAPGDIILGIRASIGTKVLADRPYCLGRGVAGLRPKDGRLDSRFLWHWLTNASSELASKGRGATFLQVNRSDITSMAVPLPPIEEQRRIAAILDHADSLTVRRRLSMDLLAQASEAAFGTALERLGPDREPLGDLAEVRIGPFGSLLHKDDYIDGGVPLVNPMHIVDGRIRANSSFAVSEVKAAELARYRLREGDVVMGRRGEMGRCAVVGLTEAGYLCGTGSLIVRPLPSRTSAQWLKRVLSHRSTVAELESRALGITLLNLNTKIVQGLMVPAAPLETQIELDRQAQLVQAHRIDQESSLATLERLAAALQARAFAGEL